MTSFPTIGFIIIHKKLNVDDGCFSQSLFLPSSPIKYQSPCILCVQLYVSKLLFINVIDMLMNQKYFNNWPPIQGPKWLQVLTQHAGQGETAAYIAVHDENVILDTKRKGGETNRQDNYGYIQNWMVFLLYSSEKVTSHKVNNKIRTERERAKWHYYFQEAITKEWHLINLQDSPQ